MEPRAAFAPQSACWLGANDVMQPPGSSAKHVLADFTGASQPAVRHLVAKWATAQENIADIRECDEEHEAQQRNHANGVHHGFFFRRHTFATADPLNQGEDDSATI
jgi:hypothetical protein